MTRIRRHRSFQAPTEVVWEVVTDPDLYEKVAPNLTSVVILDGDGEGMVRECVDTNGNVWTESCYHWEEGREFAVAVDVETSDFHRRLFTRFEGEWRLTRSDEGVVVRIAFRFDTKYGPLGWLVARYFKYKAPALIEAIFDGWEAEIDDRLAGCDPSIDDPDSQQAKQIPNRLYR